MSVFRQRRGTAAALAAANETPAAGQIVFELDTNRIKIGDGVRSYNQLSYLDNDIAVTDVAGLRSELDGLQSAVSVITADSRWTNQRVPVDGSVTASKFAAGLLIDGPRYQHRRGTLAALTSSNPTPVAGELVYETDTNRVKIGDGTSNYTTLPYLTTGQTSGEATPAAVLDSLTFDGTTTAFTMRVNGTAVTPPSYAYLLISLNGVIQRPGVSYTTSGSLITFSQAPAASDDFFGIIVAGSAPHSHSAADIVSGTISADRLPGTVVYTTDARLANSRPPTAHSSSHSAGQADAITPAQIGAAAAIHVHDISAVTGLQAALDGKQAAGAYAASSHTHSATDIVSGVLNIDRIPDSVIRYTDPRLTDSRTPLSHKASHSLGGADAITPAAIGAAAASHTHGLADVYGLQTALSERAFATHDHDARYYTQSQIVSLLAGKQDTGSYAPTAHTHTIGQVNGLQSALDSKATPAEVSSAITAVVGAAPAALDTLQELAAALDNNSSYASSITTALAGKASVSHAHTASQITDFAAAVIAAAPPTTDASLLTTGTLSASRLPNTVVFTTDSRLTDSRSPTAHSHVVGDVTGLQTALDGKAAVSHAHSAADVTSGTVAVARLPTVLEQTVTGGNTGTAVTLSLASGSVQTWTLNGNCTFTMPTATAGASLTIFLTQSSTYTATFTGVKWSGGTAPTITATANKVDVFLFISNGTSWFGSAVQNF